MSGRFIGLIAGPALGLTTSVAAQPVSMFPATMPRIGTVDERYQSYNVEALEVTGGKFWKPYGPEFDAILKNPTPASDASSGDTPEGFSNVLTQQWWKDVVEFSKAADAGIVTSIATGVGVHIAAAEFMNEPNLAAMGGAPEGYTEADYGRDFKLFRAFAREAAPDMLILGPGSVGESIGSSGVVSGYTSSVTFLATRGLPAASQPASVDGFAYHHYGAVSLRCSAQGNQTTPEAALSEDWLGRTDQTLAFYRALRDEFAPGTPFWNTETADAASGGNPWANTFADTFR